MGGAVVPIDTGQAEGNRDHPPVCTQRRGFLLAVHGLLLARWLLQRARHVAVESLAGKQACRTAQKSRSTLVGQLDTPLGIAQQGRHRKLFNKMAETRLALLQSRTQLLTAAQRTLTQVEVTADQQRKQQG